MNLPPQGFLLKDDIVFAGNGLGLKNLWQAGKTWLEVHVHQVNCLNVFPVPDGDTGTNMLLTMRSALQEVEKVRNYEAGAVAAAMAHGALMGARGNSGVIFSQFLQGVADGLAGRAIFTAAMLAHALDLGMVKSYKSVITPVEGTILTVARRAAEAAQQSAATNQDLMVWLKDVVEAIRVAQAETPELLPILKEAGVTDSGGQGFLYIFEGGLRWMTHKPLEVDLRCEEGPMLQSILGAEEEVYGYDVQFLIHGDRLDVEEIRTQMDRIGWSTLVVGNERLVKVHVHAHDPGLPLSFGASQGSLSDVVIEDMTRQAREFAQEHRRSSLPPLTFPAHMTERLIETRTHAATICVAPSQGLAHILHSLGASQIVLGGQTMNPSPQELLEAVNRVNGENVLILPNNSNVILAAQQVQKLSKKNIRVVPTKTIPQGIAALLSLNYQSDLETNAQRMLSAAQQVQTIEITRAVRDTAFNGFQIKLGDIMGLLNEELINVGRDYDEVAVEVLSKIEVNAHEVITIYFGQDSSLEQATALAGKIKALYPEIETEIHNGGQPYYCYIISLE